MRSWDWLAGVLDCDGAIGLSTRKVKGKEYTSPQIQFGNTDKKLIEAVANILECNISLNKVKPNSSRLGTKPYYVCGITSKPKCKHIIKCILPYLITKKEKAYKVLVFIENNPPNYGGKRFSIT